MDLDDDELIATRRLNGADKSKADEMLEKLDYENKLCLLSDKDREMMINDLKSAY